MADLVITITIPEAARQDFIEAYAETFSWTAELGITKAAFAKDIIREKARDPFRRWRRAKAEAAAIATIVTVDDGITLT